MAAARSQREQPIPNVQHMINFTKYERESASLHKIDHQGKREKYSR